MKLHFTKMQGCGNDYVYIDCLTGTTPGGVLRTPESLAVRLSDRHFGVGGDGLVLMLPSAVADARMRMFNLDGSEGRMCGNAIRCVAKYLYDHDIVRRPTMTIETLSGIKELSLTTKGDTVLSVTVNMGRAALAPEKIPVRLPGDRVVQRPVSVNGHTYLLTCVSMGNPHAVLFCDDLDTLPLASLGPSFENHPLFPERVNTEFVKLIGRNQLQMRVWERGSGETLACGTGACAAAVAAVLGGYCDRGADIRLTLRGGELVVRYTEEAVTMTGGCQTVFEGTIDLDDTAAPERGA